MLAVYERRHGRPLDLGGSPDMDNPASSMGVHLSYLLFEDPVFQQAVLNPAVLTLVDYMLGRNCILKNCLSLLKGPGGPDLSVHCDNGRVSSPFPPHDITCNFTWALTDYSAENGALFMIPGSHKQYRHPKPGEGLEDKAIIECPAGSLIAWTGRTWHGAVARTAPGVRVNLITAMCRPYIRPQEPYREERRPGAAGPQRPAPGDPAGPADQPRLARGGPHGRRHPDWPPRLRLSRAGANKNPAADRGAPGFDEAATPSSRRRRAHRNPTSPADRSPGRPELRPQAGPGPRGPPSAPGRR